jgi:hypothetical protein
VVTDHDSAGVDAQVVRCNPQHGHLLKEDGKVYDRGRAKENNGVTMANPGNGEVVSDKLVVPYNYCMPRIWARTHADKIGLVLSGKIRPYLAFALAPSLATHYYIN